MQAKKIACMNKDIFEHKKGEKLTRREKLICRNWRACHKDLGSLRSSTRQTKSEKENREDRKF